MSVVYEQQQKSACSLDKVGLLLAAERENIYQGE